ncbi:MAG TPA: hypothetical protein ENI94_13795 [Gammaproteobacteria bacterium]|nr:hypothetical protein [Gammaproteobacteria bacterium]
MDQPLFLPLLIALSTLGIGSQSLASELQTVKFQVDNMTYSMCPYTVKKALKKIDGIEKG